MARKRTTKKSGSRKRRIAYVPVSYLSKRTKRSTKRKSATKRKRTGRKKRRTTKKKVILL